MTLRLGMLRPTPSTAQPVRDQACCSRCSQEMLHAAEKQICRRKGKFERGGECEIGQPFLRVTVLLGYLEG